MTQELEDKIEMIEALIQQRTFAGTGDPVPFDLDTAMYIPDDWGPLSSAIYRDQNEDAREHLEQVIEFFSAEDTSINGHEAIVMELTQLKELLGSRPPSPRA